MTAAQRKTITDATRNALQSAIRQEFPYNSTFVHLETEEDILWDLYNTVEAEVQAHEDYSRA